MGADGLLSKCQALLQEGDQVGVRLGLHLHEALSVVEQTAKRQAKQE